MAGALQTLFLRRHFRRERVFRDRTNPLYVYADVEMIKRYRFPRASVLALIGRVSPILERPTRRSMSISTSTQVLATLRFLAKGDYQSETSDLHCISTASCSRIIHKTCVAINTTLQNINFPIQQELGKIKEGFYGIAGFPNVIGAVDGTLIPIQGLSGEEEPNYVFRKGYHAINVQAVVDYKLRFTNVVVRWPGGTHDAFILQQSAVFTHMEALVDNGWLIGDSGYPLKSWLITPLGNQLTAQEIRLRKAHCKTRNTVERAFGVLKQRFRCLHKTGGALSYKPERGTNIIESCFRLHNLALDNNVPLNRDPPLPLLQNNHVLTNRTLLLMHSGMKSFRDFKIQFHNE